MSPQTIGPYRVLRELDRGANGVVFEAQDPLLDRRVAVKVLLPGGGSPVEGEAYFKREMQAAARLRHPHIVAVHAAGLTHEGRPYLAMDLLEGGTLDAVLKTHGPFEPERAARVVHRVAEALAYAHAQGVLHRDVKPANVLLDERGEPHLGDFGLAQLVDDPQRMTRTGDFVGTLAYASPEQVRGERARFGPATDVYALGALLFVCLVGRPPFAGQETLRVASRIASEPAAFPPEAARRIPARLQRVCLECLAKEPSERPASAGAVAASLEGFLLGEGTRREPVPLGGGRRPSAPGPGGSRRQAALALGVGLALGAAAALGAESALDAESPPEVQRLYDRGLDRYSRGDSEGAIADMEAVLAREPDDCWVWNRLGMALHQDERYEEAIGAYDRALALEPDADDGAVIVGNRAHALHELGRDAEARADFDRAIADDPRLPSAWTGRAAVRKDADDLAGALADYERAIELDPRHVGAICQRAMVRFAQGAEQEELFPEFDRALAILPDHAAALRNRAAVRDNTGDAAGAIEDYTRALAAELDDDPETLIRRGQVYLVELEHLAACADFLVAEGVAPERPDAVLWKGVAFANMGLAAEALRAVDRARSLSEPGSEVREQADALRARLLGG